MEASPTRVVNTQRRVVGLSLTAAALATLGAVVSAYHRPLTWDAALAGVVVINAGVQITSLLGQERRAGITDGNAMWRVLAIMLFMLGAALISVGGFALWHRLAAN